MVGCWWLLREIELANLLTEHISFPSPDEAVLFLPASKTDQSGVGVQRGCRCICRSAHASVAGRNLLCP
eukprot:5224825-Lingulodinium_polyedra.AAC.1